MNNTYFETKNTELPRPKSWMPGPVAPWALLNLNNRSLSLDMVQNYLESQRSKDVELEAAFVKSSEEPAVEDVVAKERPSAVLVPFITTDNKTIESVIVTTRTMTVNSHKGQVSFPGGRIEEGDENELQAALREAKEEINLEPQVVKIIGQSSLTQTRSKFSKITPFVGVINKADLGELIPSNEEVETIHIVNVDQLFAPDNYSSEVWDFGEISPTIHIYRVHDNNDQPVFIWGATAHILTDILHCLESS